MITLPYYSTDCNVNISMHQLTPIFVWYLTKPINDERWYLARIDENCKRYWTKNVSKGKHWYGLPAAKTFMDENFQPDEVALGGRMTTI